jgi:hypothetical protein
MFEDEIHTQRDKTFSGAFDPTEFEAFLNAHDADGWRLTEGFMVSSLWKSMKSEIVLILERFSIPSARRHEPDTNGATPPNHGSVTSGTDHAERRDGASRCFRSDRMGAVERIGRTGSGELPTNGRPRGQCSCGQVTRATARHRTPRRGARALTTSRQM